MILTPLLGTLFGNARQYWRCRASNAGLKYLYDPVFGCIGGITAGWWWLLQLVFPIRSTSFMFEIGMICEDGIHLSSISQFVLIMCCHLQCFGIRQRFRQCLTNGGFRQSAWGLACLRGSFHHWWLLLLVSQIPMVG